MLVPGAFGQSDLIISEIVDGTLPYGNPKWVELTNVGCSGIDLTAYSFGNFNNGGTTLGGGAATVLTGTLASGASYVISYEAAPTPPEISVFEDVYGFVPDLFMGGTYINGDDVLALFLGAATGDGSDATLVDVYGVIGVDGTGQPWEYTDSYSYRNANITQGNATFTLAEWTIAGPDALEDPGGDDLIEEQNLLDYTDPGTHTYDDPCGPPELIINEVDADQTGTDVAEFVELYDGGIGNTDLTGLVLVLINGTDDAA
jgi:hypothetical protein